MDIQNQHLGLQLDGQRLTVTRRSTGERLDLDWPAVALSVRGRELRPQAPAAAPRRSGRGLSQRFEQDGLVFVVSVVLGSGPWFRKRLSVRRQGGVWPTVDFVEVDRQVLRGDGLRLCGYQATTPTALRRGAEEGGGVMPGCGYPLIGRRCFLGLEHPAGFNHVEARAGGEDLVWLRHHPVWRGKVLEAVAEVFGWAEAAPAAFADYLDTIRLPRLRQALVAFGTFWSDPYIGNGEYRVSLSAYRRFFKAFQTLGLVPDLFTLDAGWQDRRSIFDAKPEVGGDAGLEQLCRQAEAMGSALSLWVSHNGHIGIDPEYLKSEGLPVGGGFSGTYEGEGYGVMLDEGLAARITARFRWLVQQVGVRHLKIDWDNDCATNPSFGERYPSRHHVRQATIDVFMKIGRELRRQRPGVVLRNGWWPSPWWLPEANHVWLSDSGDAEYAALPSATARDAAATHRDLMYYNHLRRDGTPLPLDCFDNHEFPDSQRNPFSDDPAAWANTVWLAFLRGATYIPLTLMPESLEDWQVECLRRVMAFSQRQARSLYVARGRMVLGHPGRGEVYGFLQPGRTESWAVLRNPLPLPQTLAFDPSALAEHEVRTVWQFYPHYEVLNPAPGLTFLGHEVKVVILAAARLPPVHREPCMVSAAAAGFLYHFPASCTVGGQVEPLVHPIHRLPGLACRASRGEVTSRGTTYRWHLVTPARMRQLDLQFCLKGAGAGEVQPRAYISRYPGSPPGGYTVPVTTIAVGMPGYGEAKNRDITCDPAETFFTVRLPDGGEFSLNLVLPGGPTAAVLKAVWLSGYEAPGRTALRRQHAPARFADCLPYQHPLGFGRALELPIPRTGEAPSV